MAKIIELIYSEEERRGTGTEDNPHRIIRQLFTKDGRLVAQDDPCGATFFHSDPL